MIYTDDTLARYDPLEAVMQITEKTGEEERVVAQVLEGEVDFLSCLGLVDESALDEASLHEIQALRNENSDLLEICDGEYDADVAVLFIQRNRGIDKDVIARVLAANYAFMDERGFLDEEWGEAWASRDQETTD